MKDASTLAESPAPVGEHRGVVEAEKKERDELRRGSFRGALGASVGSGSASEESISCGEARKRGSLDFRTTESISGEEEKRCFGSEQIRLRVRLADPAVAPPGQIGFGDPGEEVKAEQVPCET